MKIITIILITLWITVQPAFCSTWHNFKSGQSEEVTEPIMDYSPYIPQDKAAQGLYRIYVETGDTPCKAAIKVLKEISE